QIQYLLKASGAGSIIFMSSVAGVVSVGAGSIYAASKGLQEEAISGRGKLKNPSWTAPERQMRFPPWWHSSA
ncbi:hypothetical protein CJ030_MR5G027229, partial [Morella rubra]